MISMLIIQTQLQYAKCIQSVESGESMDMRAHTGNAFLLLYWDCPPVVNAETLSVHYDSIVAIALFFR